MAHGPLIHPAQAIRKSECWGPPRFLSPPQAQNKNHKKFMVTLPPWDKTPPPSQNSPYRLIPGPRGRSRGNSLSNGTIHTSISSGGSRPRKFILKWYNSHNHFLRGVAAEGIHCQMVPFTPSFPPGGRGRGNSLSNGTIHTIISSGGSRPRKFSN